MMEQKSFVWRCIMKLGLSTLFEEDTEGKFNFNTFPNTSQIFKSVKNFEHMDLGKIVG